MRPTLLRLIATAILVLFGVQHESRATDGASQSQDRSPTNVSRDDPTLPSNVPDGYVITPNGYFHPSCVHEVGRDEIVNLDGSITRTDGTIKMEAPCKYPRYTKSGARIEPWQNPSPSNDWVIDEETIWDSSVLALSASWTAPSPPTVISGQVLFFFIGLEQTPDDVTILQPVLEWNEWSSNEAWTMTGWDCCVGGGTHHGPTISVSPGDNLYGYVVIDTFFNQAEIEVYNLTTHQPVTWAASLYNQNFNWVFGGVLETSGVT
jgi:hypothetical protein